MRAPSVFNKGDIGAWADQTDPSLQRPDAASEPPQAGKSSYEGVRMTEALLFSSINMINLPSATIYPT